MDEGKYPVNWKEKSAQVKKEAGGRCERCGHKPEGTSRDNLVTHHLIPNKALDERWNLEALCNKCNLKAEHKNKELRQRLTRWFNICREDWLMKQLKDYADILREEGRKEKCTY